MLPYKFWLIYMGMRQQKIENWWIQKLSFHFGTIFKAWKYEKKDTKGMDVAQPI